MAIGIIESELTNFTSLAAYKTLTQLVVGVVVVMVVQRTRVISFSAADA